MRTSSTRLSIAVALLASSAAAQAPIYIDLSPGSTATDVTVANNDVVVVGIDSAGVAFRWTYSGGGEIPIGLVSTNCRVSADGTKVASTTTAGGVDRAARWDSGTWTQGPGLGGISGTSETTSLGISGDGQTVVGLGWINAGSGHCYTWNQTTGAHDFGGFFSDPSSRANGVNGDGSVVVGWKDLLSGQRQGARWMNGVIQPQFTWADPSTGIPYKLGEALGTNTAGTTIVGFRIYSAPAAYTNAGWRWDASTGLATTLQNIAGATTQAQPLGVTDDATLIVGHSGGTIIGGTTALVWINNTPTSLTAYLNSLGTIGMSGYSDLGLAYAISRDGSAICGRGTGTGLGQPSNGWVVIFPSAVGLGANYCSGDGTATACPCANNGIAGNGCANSLNANGAHLYALGFTASIASDTVVLHGAGMPNSSALYFQGTTRLNGGNGVAFGDGLRCAGGSIIRLGTKTNTSGASKYPDTGDANISVRGAITTPGTRTYQVWYRNAAAFCTASTFNLSNGLEISWGI